MKRNKAFTLIELVSVLVILAILTLIVTPLVLNIIRKARTAADKRSIDAYGRSIELAIADYLLDNGTFPTSIEQLTIEYSGDKVTCTTTQLNTDSSVYLSGCTVGNRAVEGYTYGTEETVTYEAYSVGDEVTYNNVDYYVIKDSTTSESSVTLLKAEPITSSEISSCLSSTEVASKVDTNGTYAQMAYYSSDDCTSGRVPITTGCKNDYNTSDIKKIVDIWVDNYTESNDLTIGELGFKGRLITVDELLPNLGYSWSITSAGAGENPDVNDNVPSFVYNNQYSYWTMSPKNDSDYSIGNVFNSGTIYYNEEYSKSSIRPVITIKKSALN